MDATESPPPLIKAREAAVYRAGKWQILPDWRGVDLYLVLDGQRVTITQLGQMPGDIGATETKPPSAAHVWLGGNWVEDATKKAALLDGQKAVCWDRIKYDRDRRKAGGYKAKIGSVDKWFHSDPDSRVQHLGLKDKARDLLASGGSLAGKLTVLGQSVRWKTMDGSFVEITAQIAFDIVAAAGDLDAQLFTVAEQHRVAMQAAADPAVYDYSPGWPSSYQPAPSK